MTVLKNVELRWCKLDPKAPVSPFGTPVWEAQVVTRDKNEMKEWKKLGINVKTSDDDDGIFYFANLKRKAVYEKTQTPAKPVIVVDGNVMPLDATIVGNGSIGNVQIFTKPYEFGGRKGIKVELKAIQVTKLVEYKPDGGGLAFEAIGETEIAESKPVSKNEEEDLW